ncbi:hypothetical protein LCGC14_3104990 [marine sediment metagenome]|uniref:HTH merR-type domain-containing protein n=1 Tax=marine sediment metagenome TaxID=412755 RepID=A0A0F8W740_9ZZZZ
MTTLELANTLGLKPPTIRKYARRLGLKPTGPPIQTEGRGRPAFTWTTSEAELISKAVG